MNLYLTKEAYFKAISRYLLLIRKCVTIWQGDYRSVIQAHYWEGLTLQTIADRQSVSRENVRGREAKALRILRSNEIIRLLYKDMQQHNRYCSFSWFRTSPEYYETLKRLDKKPLSYGQRQAELYAAQIAWEIQNDVL